MPDATKIDALALADNSFLVGELATPNGKKFMRKIAKSPGTYSRLDRLSQTLQRPAVVSQIWSATSAATDASPTWPPPTAVATSAR